MSVQLSRNTGRLLRRVQNKRHATDDDHDEDVAAPKKSPRLSAATGKARKSIRQPTKDDDEPLSSSDAEDIGSGRLSLVSSAGNFTASSATSADIEGDFAPLKPQSRSSARQAGQLTVPEKAAITNLKPKPSAADGSVDECDDDKMAEWANESKRRKPAKRFGYTPANFHVPKPAPQSQSVSSKTTYKKPRASGFESTSNKILSTFKNPPKALNLGQEQEHSPRPAFKMPQGKPNVKTTAVASPKRPTRSSKRIAGPETDDLHSTTGPGFKSIRNLGGLNMQGLKETARQFGVRQPDFGADGDVAVHSSQLDPDHVDLDDDAVLEDTQILSGDEEDTITCPYCHETISDLDLMRKLKRSKQMAMSRQVSFCRSHRRTEAQRQWDERGYPEIDWDTLTSRVEDLNDHIMQVIRNQRGSTFRARLEDRLASGGGRSMLQALSKDASSIDALTPGYYGGRGAKIISNQLMSTFSAEIRDCAGRDKVIGAAGASGFVQAVLVSEVAVKLIMADLGCDGRRAVQVLEESGEMGDLLFEGEDDERGTRRREWRS